MSEEKTPSPIPAHKGTDALLGLSEDSSLEDIMAVLEHTDPAAATYIANIDVEKELSAFKAAHSEFFPKQRKYTRHFTSRFLIVAALLICLLILAAVATVQRIYNFKVEGDTVVITSSLPSGSLILEEVGNQSTYLSFADALEKNNLPAMAPTWIPAVFSLSWVSYENVSDTLIVSAWYARNGKEDEGIFICATNYQDLKSLAAVVEVEHGSDTLTVVNDVDYLIAENRSRNKAVWSSGTCLFSISGSISLDELMKILSSI